MDYRITARIYEDTAKLPMCVHHTDSTYLSTLYSELELHRVYEYFGFSQRDPIRLVRDVAGGISISATPAAVADTHGRAGQGVPMGSNSSTRLWIHRATRLELIRALA